MTAWFTSPETTPRDTCPNENLARFVATNFKPPASFLDIGSGSGANSRWLEDRGFEVRAIDSSNLARANYHFDIENLEGCGWRDRFDCVIDINTLCHVENPPYEAIYKALKPGGKFFSIHPADDTQVDMAGKGYTRMADILTMRQLLGRGFMRFTIHKCINWSGDTKIASWQIVADK